MLRSILAVAAAYFAMAFIIVASTHVLASIFNLPTSSSPAHVGPLPPGYIYANLAVAFGSAAIGGCIAALLAAHSPLRHAGFLAAVLLCFGIMFALGDSGSLAPRWYFYVLPVLGILGALLGGWLVQHRRRLLGDPR